MWISQCQLDLYIAMCYWDDFINPEGCSGLCITNELLCTIRESLVK